jgi:hypothetical protein
MSHSSSVGTGTPQDDNENHPRPDDHWPSRTLGADAAPAQDPPQVVPGQPRTTDTQDLAEQPAPLAPPHPPLL